MSNTELKDWLFSFGESDEPFTEDEAVAILNRYATDEPVDASERDRIVRLMKDTHERSQAASEFRQGFRDAVLYHLL